MSLSITTPLSITTNYAGKQAGGWLAEALASSKFGSGDYATFHKTVGGKLNLSTLRLDNILQPYSCDFTPQGSVVIADRVLDPKGFKVNFEDCYDKFTTMWTDMEFDASVNQAEMPASFGDLIVTQMLKQVALGFDKYALNADVASGDQFDGLMTLAKADDATVKVAGAALTVDNVIAEMEKVYLTIPEAVMEQADVKWYMSSGDIRKYKAALAKSGNGIIAPNTSIDASIFYDGRIELVPMVEMVSGEMLVASKSNLHVGSNFLDVKNDIAVIDLRPTLGENKFRYVHNFVLDVNFGFAGEILIRTVILG